MIAPPTLWAPGLGPSPADEEAAAHIKVLKLPRKEDLSTLNAHIDTTVSILVGCSNGPTCLTDLFIHKVQHLTSNYFHNSNMRSNHKQESKNKLD